MLCNLGQFFKGGEFFAGARIFTPGHENPFKKLRVFPMSYSIETSAHFVIVVIYSDAHFVVVVIYSEGHFELISVPAKACLSENGN
jgi:hypothetical protein